MLYSKALIEFSFRYSQCVNAEGKHFHYSEETLMEIRVHIRFGVWAPNQTQMFWIKIVTFTNMYDIDPKMYFYFKY